MPALTRATALPQADIAPARRRHLHAVPPPQPRRRAPSAQAVAVYALGLVVGFVLAGLASVPGGLEVVGVQAALAALAAGVCGLAGLRARAVARRRRAGSRVRG
jgi:hypothetical protein